ncbi:hypothetical protein Taro_045659 [Colocasia esculenta]|uniref:Uncharacterized protein n=1 Tax=Colocasia esculenta TaxID=4460 RepID=A0A843X337_COLES|nr:hypothetical protein [Colocasia esculenta]
MLAITAAMAREAASRSSSPSTMVDPPAGAHLVRHGLFGWILKGSNKDGIQERLGFFAFAMSTTVYTYSNSLPVFLQEPPVAPWHSYACTWRRGDRLGATQKGYIVLYVEDVAKFVEFYANAFD